METKSIMIVGVGGQGTLLASRILGAALISNGFDVKVSEVHGMSQRGGSVVTYVKYGSKVNSPIVNEGEADLILAFEQLEAARWLQYLKKDGTLIINTQKIDPMSVIIGNSIYPDGVLDAINKAGAKTTNLDALSLAVKIVLADIYAARQTDPGDIHSRDIQKLLLEKGKEAYYFPSFEEIEKFLREKCINGDLLITMGAGDVVLVGEALIK